MTISRHQNFSRTLKIALLAWRPTNPQLPLSELDLNDVATIALFLHGHDMQLSKQAHAFRVVDQIPSIHKFYQNI